jgi:hypothetical protein
VEQRQALSHADADKAEALAAGDMEVDLAGLPTAEVGVFSPRATDCFAPKDKLQPHTRAGTMLG